MEIKTFRKLNKRGKLFIRTLKALAIIVLIIAIMWVLNVKAVGTRGETSVGFRDLVCEVIG